MVSEKGRHAACVAGSVKTARWERGKERGGGPLSMLAIAVTLPVIFLEGRAEVSVNVAEVSCCVDESKEESESLG